MAYGGERSLGERTVATGVASKGRYTSRVNPLTKDPSVPKSTVKSSPAMSTEAVTSDQPSSRLNLASIGGSNTTRNTSLTSDANTTSVANSVARIGAALNSAFAGPTPTFEQQQLGLGLGASSSDVSGGFFRRVGSGIQNLGSRLGFQEGGFLTRNK